MNRTREKSGTTRERRMILPGENNIVLLTSDTAIVVSDCSVTYGCCGETEKREENLIRLRI